MTGYDLTMKDMMVGFLDSEAVVFLPGQVMMMQGMDMTLFKITNYALLLRRIQEKVLKWLL